MTSTIIAAAYSTALIVVTLTFAAAGWGSYGVVTLLSNLMIAFLAVSILGLIFAVFCLFYEEWFK